MSQLSFEEAREWLRLRGWSVLLGYRALFLEHRELQLTLVSNTKDDSNVNVVSLVQSLLRGPYDQDEVTKATLTERERCARVCEDAAVGNIRIQVEMPAARDGAPELAPLVLFSVAGRIRKGSGQ